MTIQRAADVVNSEPWLITEDGLRVIMAIAERTTDVDALVTRQGTPLMNTRRVQVRDGVAIVPVVGPIMRYANLFSEISGATSTQILATDIRAAIDDPLIRALVLDINSPGGMVAGINELADMIFSARSEKPIIAYAGGQMASAAYWIGSAADRIVADRTAVLGSIGAVMTIQDSRSREERAGVRTIEIVSSQSPDKRMDPTEDAGRAKLQKIVDDLGAVFVSAVARNRGTDEEDVLQNFGRGGLMVGQVAVDAGLADNIGSLESVIEELTARNKPTRSFAMSTANRKTTEGNRGPITVRTTAELRAAIEAGHAADEITLETVDVEKIKADAIAAHDKEQEPKIQARIDAALKDANGKTREEAAKAERERVAQLQGLAATTKGFEKEIQAAIDKGTSFADAAAEVVKLGKERGVTVSSLRQGAPAAVAHGGSGSDAPAAQGKWGSITAKFKSKK